MLYATFAASKAITKDLFQKETKKLRKDFEFELDSGTRDSFISSAIWTELGCPKLQRNSTEYRSATGNILPIYGSFKTEVSIPEKENKAFVTFNVTPKRLNLLGRVAIYVTFYVWI